MSIPDHQSNHQAKIEAIRTGALNRFWTAMVCRWLGCRTAARYEMQMGWERMTNTGDYAPGGHFDKMYPGWRDSDSCCDVFHSANPGHRRIRSPQAAPIAQDEPHDDRRTHQPERATDGDSGNPGDGKPRAMAIPPFLAGE